MTEEEIQRRKEIIDNAIAEAIDEKLHPNVKAATDLAVERVDKRRARVQVLTEKTETGFTQSTLKGGSNRYREMAVADAFGTSSQEFVNEMLGGLLTVFNPKTDRRATQNINAALAVLDGQKPADEVEAMLITQMVATHEMAMRSLAAGLNGHGEAIDSFANIANKMLRTYASQVEALAKLRRKGEQTVKVVHVYPGGQAVVGDVHHHQEGGGPPKEIEAQPHEKAANAPLGSLPSPNPLGDGMPVPGDAQRPMPAARRAKSGGSDGK